MTLHELENIIVKAFCELDSKVLERLDDRAIYSFDYKEELIEKLQKIFNEYKSKSLNKLESRESKCKFCYPKSNAFSFHDPTTGELLIRYVFAYTGETDDEENIYRVEECRNKPIPDDIWPGHD